jgi:DNA-binding transcriptional MocR family regulator
MTTDRSPSSKLDETGATPRYLVIANDLAQAIGIGHFANGDKLPPQRQLAAEQGVTIGTITRAYAALERRGLVVARVGDGTYVSCGTPGFAHSTPIDLAHNVPLTAPAEVNALQQALQALASDTQVMREMLDYQPELGHRRHREAGAQWLRRLATTGDSNRVMVTNGVQHGLAFVLRIFARPGDVILTEALSYHGLIPLAQEFRLQIVGVDTDAQGLIPDAVDRAATTYGARLLYCMPTLQTPVGSTMSIPRRDAIARVVRRRRLLLVEDCVHAMAHIAPLPALSTLVPEQSFLLASFSKVVAAGLRVGFLEADPRWLSKFAATMRADSFMVAPLGPEVVTQWLESGLMAQLIAAHRTLTTNRLTCALTLMNRFAKRAAVSVDFSSDPMFPFLWLRLPPPWKAAELVNILRSKGVLVRSADHFRMGRSIAPQALRISLNSPSSVEDLESGLMTVLQTIFRSTDPEGIDPA